VTPIVTFSRKRQAWVIYERPSRREAVAHAQATTAVGWDRSEGKITGCLPMVWPMREGAFLTAADAEASLRPVRRIAA